MFGCHVRFFSNRLAVVYEFGCRYGTNDDAAAPFRNGGVEGVESFPGPNILLLAISSMAYVALCLLSTWN